jgi:hypothetical protein
MLNWNQSCVELSLAMSKLQFPLSGGATLLLYSTPCRLGNWSIFGFFGNRPPDSGLIGLAGPLTTKQQVSSGQIRGSTVFAPHMHPAA